MRPPKYPLKTLAEERRRRVDEAARALAETLRERDAAARARRAAELRCEEHERVTERARETERAALARGELHAADLARAEAWASRVATERGALMLHAEAARAREVEVSECERKARATLALRKADAQVVTNDHARWKAAQRKAVEVKDEEASAEAWRPKT